MSANSVWQEHVKKENRVIKLGTEFHMTDARKLTVLPEKPNHTVPTAFPSAESLAAASQKLADMSSLKDTEKIPHQRFALPLTANMEYGFFSSQPLVPRNPMFDHRTRQGDVTEYASHYVRMAGTGPYNTRKDP